MKNRLIQKRHAFVMVPHDLIRSHLSSSAIRLYCGLHLYSLPSFPSWTRIRKDIGSSYATIAKAQKELVEANIVTIERGNCRKKANRYSMTDKSSWTLPEKPPRFKKQNTSFFKKCNLETEATTATETETLPLQYPEPNKSNGSYTNENKTNEQQTIADNENDFPWLTAVLSQPQTKNLLVKTLIERWYKNGNFENELEQVVNLVKRHFSSSSEKAKNYGTVLIAEALTIRAMFVGLHETDPRIIEKITLDFMLKSHFRMALDINKDNKIDLAKKDYPYGLSPEEVVYVRMKAHVHHKSDGYQWAFVGQSKFLGVPVSQKSRK